MEATRLPQKCHLEAGPLDLANSRTDDVARPQWSSTSFATRCASLPRQPFPGVMGAWLPPDLSGDDVAAPTLYRQTNLQLRFSLPLRTNVEMLSANTTTSASPTC